jgi:hypothetical protein
VLNQLELYVTKQHRTSLLVASVCVCVCVCVCSFETLFIRQWRPSLVDSSAAHVLLCFFQSTQIHMLCPFFLIGCPLRSDNCDQQTHRNDRSLEAGLDPLSCSLQVRLPLTSHAHTLQCLPALHFGDFHVLNRLELSSAWVIKRGVFYQFTRRYLCVEPT